MIRPAIVLLILALLILGIIGFMARWSMLLYHPGLLFDDFYSIVDDLFSLLLLYEVLDLLRSLSPVRLLDLLLTIFARKLLLSPGNPSLTQDMWVFVIMLILRLVWTRFSEKET
ncbi:hypothetical protein [Ferroacidibacillus organovorans]|uniref:Uncharacterized protein n=1 Tax=Ferroacidibacillus organovorans TaxID=1765683 RepID=A0A161QHV2_9BACL|nr:hypothetical protein [Ferroacidibacillus organovorans]KYP81770.1 hypothetical protein AYJ22_05915 [Ferroacidibacillus organovorans]OAG93298.1 hypothetical protein AYW79_11330 [Ferroacidibacillus organovorans]OPG16108.1 hypothetical protein B2M26_08680 [Ferroacidibacillus organovorans]